MAVTGITGVPATGASETAIDLSPALAVPSNATNRTIVWSVPAASPVKGTVDGKVLIANGPGNLILRASVARGAGPETAFTREFVLTITQNHVPVTDITEIPESGDMWGSIDLSKALVVPANASNKAIVWAVTGGTAQASVSEDKTTLSLLSAGSLKLSARISGGKAQGEDYTKEFTLTIINRFVAVTGITGVPTEGEEWVDIDLSGVEVEPATASNRIIEWSVPEESEVTGAVVENILQADQGGNLKLNARISNGIWQDEDYTQEFTLTINKTFKAVTGITGVPASGPPSEVIDLSVAQVLPLDARKKTILWSVAGNSDIGATVSGSTVRASAEGNLKLMATISGGVGRYEDYTQEFTIKITSSTGPTADVGFTATSSDTCGLAPDGIGELSGANEELQTLTMEVKEQSKVYFGVTKGAGQTITVGGTNGNLVTQAAKGKEVDGSTSGDTLSLFTVDTSAFDLMFEGGNRSFELEVREENKEPKTVTVTLNVTPNKTGVAVFKVTRPEGDQGFTKNMTSPQAEDWAVSGSLERVPAASIKTWKFGTSKTSPGSWNTALQGNRVLDALAWADHQSVEGAANGEYLIRVEKDEALPKIDISARADKITPGGKVTIRLRGSGGEKILSYDKSQIISSGTFDYHRKDLWGNTFPPVDRYSGIISLDRGIGAGQSMNKVYSGQLTLCLENGITLKADVGAAPVGQRPYGAIDLHGDSKLVMLEGSKISGVPYNSAANAKSSGVICLNVWNNLMPSMYMFGGTITENVTDSTGTIYFQDFDAVHNEVFVKKGGSITGNMYDSTPHDKVTVFKKSQFGGNLVLNITGQNEELLFPTD